LYDIIDREIDYDEYFENIIQFGFGLIKKGEYFSIPFWEQAMKIPRIRKYWMEEHQKIMIALAEGASDRTPLVLNDSVAMMRILSAVLDGMIVQHQMCRDSMDLESQEKELVKIVKAYLKRAGDR
jgi:hypothetical protein